ncbi:MAG: redox-regulated ATPase YchF [Candidatus Iainarchaeum archaeon]|uniref:Redox-regulated ATPase YchF n=1 Tax=Candidatus Iainarchaeum sp. TaxID=3101447 RepID=A0A497JEU9_9ARCH|nr:MAG: redox-regulated ATPase YchF [Candidatus Diapherotrites archaeon]
MEIALVGAPNSGKSTFFNAATLGNAEVGNRPFVTIKPNEGIAYVKVKCPHNELGKECNPKHGYCKNGWRFVPIKLWDVAGLVPQAWQGKGLGNQFLNDIMQAQALIHVLDASGSTDTEGNIVGAGNFDPEITLTFLEKEIAYWIKGIIERSLKEVKHVSADASVKILAKHLSGLGISEDQVKEVVNSSDEFKGRASEWNAESLLKFAERVREISKPMIIAANKADLSVAEQNIEKLKKKYSSKEIIPVSAEAELALRKASESGLIEYVPGESDFKELKDIPENQKKALEYIRNKVLKKFGSTGVQHVLNSVAFELLELIVVFPVEDQNRWSDSKGNVLPDAFLLKKGSTALDLAYKVHTEIGKRFVAAIDCRTGQKIGKETQLKQLDVIKIITR